MDSGRRPSRNLINITFEQLATNTLGLLDQLGVAKVSVVGHSMGGMLATRFALMVPDRVEMLALIDPIGLEDWKRVVPYRTVDQWLRKRTQADCADQQKRYQSESYYHGEWRPEHDRWVRLATGWLSSPDYAPSPGIRHSFTT